MTAGVVHEVATCIYAKEEGAAGLADGDTTGGLAIPNPLAAPSPVPKQLRGFLRRRVSRNTSSSKQNESSWIKAFFVLTEGGGNACGSGAVLHQYGSPEHAARKGQSANKKHRLRLIPNKACDASDNTTVRVLDDDTSNGSNDNNNNNNNTKNLRSRA
mmetsp:Transcript_115872/g.236892  ORF Transcript_115872/g.236892 Transcript_115872/m.236892 type:complete len:158 (+) Transcript_115872:90-563(+)